MFKLDMLPKLLTKNSEPYFLRIYGWQKESIDFLNKYFEALQENGFYINETIQNPMYNNISEFINQDNIQYKESELINFFSTSNMKNELAKNLINFINETTFANENIKKNSYIKIACWLKYKFLNKILIKNLKILYEGDINKYEFYFLMFLNYFGADVILLNYTSDLNFKSLKIKSDTEEIYFENFTKPNIDFKNLSKKFEYTFNNSITKENALKDILTSKRENNCYN